MVDPKDLASERPSEHALKGNGHHTDLNYVICEI